ncbi:MAG: hypothetical protein ABIK93_02730 [candidate division WOR-3 bacterium]
MAKDLTDVGIALSGWSYLHHFQITFDPKTKIFEMTDFRLNEYSINVKNGFGIVPKNNPKQTARISRSYGI